MPDESLGPYQILEPLGSGGMGTVYLAEDSRLQRRVALKLVARAGETDEARERLLREARTAARLNHGNICSIHEVGEVGGEAFIDMELVEGRPLSAVVEAGPLPPATMVRYGVQMADALAHAHRHGIVHGDFKSANVMVTDEDGIKVLDFGLARVLPPPRFTGAAPDTTTQSATNVAGTVGGTLPYMAPETLEGRGTDQLSDVWALGAVLYEAAAGRRPFTGRTGFELTTAILRDPPPPLPDHVPAALAAIIAKCLEKNPRLRFRSAGEVKAALEAASWSQSQTVVPSPPPSPRRVAALAAVVMLAAAAAVAAWLWGGLGGGEGRDGMPGATGADGPGIAAPVPAHSLAVLPFTYAGETADQEYLGAMVADGLIARLQQLPGVAVAPFDTIIGLGEVEEPAAAAGALDVDHVVHGSIHDADDGGLSVSWTVGGADGAPQAQGTVVGNTEQPDALIDALARALYEPLELGTPAAAPAELRSTDMEAARIYLEAVALAHDWNAVGNLDTAIDRFRAALAADPDFSAAHAGLAMALVRRWRSTGDPGMLADARDAAEQAVDRAPGLAEGWLAHGMVAMVGGESVRAEADLKRALQLSPGNDAAYRSVADLYARAGHYVDAKDYFERAVRLRPDYWENHYRYGSFLADYLRSPDEARRHLERATELLPEGPAALVARGNIHLLRGQLEQAEFYYEKALLRGQDPDAYANLGYIHYVRGNYDLALEKWQDILHNWGALVGADGASSPHPSHYSNVGDALRQLGDTAAAAEHYEEALRGYRELVAADPGDDRTRAEMALVLASAGRCNTWQAELEATLVRHPDNVYALYYGLQAAARCGQNERALELARALLAQEQMLLEMWRDPDLQIVREQPELADDLEAALRAADLWRPTFALQ